MNGRQRELTLRFLVEPADVNYGGKVHGGVVMKWIDQAGYAAAVAWSGHYSVTVAVGGIRFVAPIRISDLVTVAVKLVHTGTSSMHFMVEVSARDPMQGPDQDRLCTHCVIVFVALDQAEGRPMAVQQRITRSRCAVAERGRHHAMSDLAARACSCSLVLRQAGKVGEVV